MLLTDFDVIKPTVENDTEQRPIYTYQLPSLSSATEELPLSLARPGIKMGVTSKGWTAIPIIFHIFISLVNASCFYHSPAFPPPDYSKPWPDLLDAFGHIEASVSALVDGDSSFNTSSYSIEVTSSESTLWSTFHTAQVKDPKRPGAEEVNGDSVYRIASITKVFTVMGILRQHEAGNLSLDDSVVKYIPDLEKMSHSHGGTIRWKDITLRSLASQLSGIPRDFAQGDLIIDLPDPSIIGLPPLDWSPPDKHPRCASNGGYEPCTAQDLLENLSRRPPMFAPNQKSTYSNIAFELLGLVLANVTGMPYEEYIETAVLKPMNKVPPSQSHSSFTKPPDSVAVLPKDISWYWDMDEGVQNPTGGLYFSSSAMSRVLRYILTHYNGAGPKLTSAMNWLQPASFTPGMSSFYGTPWEIFRTNRILLPAGGERTVSFFTKGGGLPGYSTVIALVPEYGLAITIFTAGSNATLLGEILERVTVPLIRGADKAAQKSIQRVYAGRYTYAVSSSPDSSPAPPPGTTTATTTLNSSLTLTYTAAHGLEITNWISNGTDMFPVMRQYFGLEDVPSFHIQLIPTLLFRDEVHRKGELWRMALAQGRPNAGKGKVWDNFCISDVDPIMYGGRPVNEVVFWDRQGGEGGDGSSYYETIELPAFRVSMSRSSSSDEVEHGAENEFELHDQVEATGEEKLFVQDL